ncbi:MAG: type II toxin-antitoxin system Phd/YefM family antitoxin [Gemmatimonadetes bacterium]|nr:type II toxin-antitoxin system Phd/YefM family antitoxin [Gemmatimonadota bacterium]MYG84040.1 type II toxin-antitoxin system Phd/YefM family antitoxin [Gemmatimonadota bacterium]MYJ89524.1 type II toxin-antitoxin system Phd/YefM family antitoxin [Gemmatimonadota bacterium]
MGGTLNQHEAKPSRVWKVSEAKARLSEILRLSEEEGPQRIGTRRPFVVIPERVWRERKEGPRKAFGQWLLENIPRGTNLTKPDRSTNRKTPFADDDE